MPKPPDIQHALNSTVILLADTYNDDRFIGICAAEYIGPNTLVTAYHCIDSATGCEANDAVCYKNHTVGFVSYEQYVQDSEHFKTGWVSAFDMFSDLAIIETAWESKTFVRIQSAPPAVGQRVFAVGHPNMNWYRVVEGIVHQPIVVMPDPEIEVDIDTGPGSSGGGLYNTDGELLGVCSKMSLDGKRGFFIPSAALMALLFQAE